MSKIKAAIERKLKKTYISLKVKFILVIVASIPLAFLCAWTVYTVGGYMIDDYIARTDFYNNQDALKVKELQKYIDKNHLSKEDLEEVNDWAVTQHNIYLSIYDGNTLIYDSYYYGYEEEQEEEATLYSGSSTEYELEFSDGEAGIFLINYSENKMYYFLDFASIALFFLIFLITVLLVIRHYIDYIKKIQWEVQVLEGGNLSCPITVKGNDEMASLAESLEDMRKSFIERLEMEDELVKANHQLITRMSHDLRTPLTNILLYAEILKAKKFRDEKQEQECLDKLIQKTIQVKELSDHMFEHFFVTSENHHEQPEWMNLKEVVPELLSDIVMVLSEKGFQANVTGEYKNVSVYGVFDYLVRISSNIISNVEKYADPSSPVEITITYRGTECIIGFSNKIKRGRDKQESTCLGVANITYMMERMKGSAQIVKTDSQYTINLSFHL